MPPQRNFWNTPFLPRVGRTLQRIINSSRATSSMASYDALGSPSEGQINLPRNPLRGFPLISRRRPLREESYPTEETPVLPSGTPMVGFDAYPTIPQFIPPPPPQTVGTRGTISTAEAIAQSNANITPYQREAYERLSMTPSSAGVVRSVSQPAPTGIAGGTMAGLSEVARQFPSQLEQAPIAPVTTNITGQTERRGVRTAYGMVYPSSGQEAAARQLAMRRPMEGRLQNVREQQVRPKFVEFAVNTPAPPEDPQKWLQDLTQAEKIQVMRQRGKRLATKVRMDKQAEFIAAQEEKRARQIEEDQEAARRKSLRTAKGRGGQTTQRSWSNYTGDNPIANFADIYEDEDTAALARSKQRGKRTA